MSEVNAKEYNSMIKRNLGEQLGEEIHAAGGEWHNEFPDAIGRTLFDLPGSQDHTVTVVLPAEKIAQIPSGALVRIRSRSQVEGDDSRQYLGVVVQGPFAEPDGLRADTPVVVTITARGGLFMPRYHGRIQVRIMGEELENGALIPPRFRPLPSSPVYLLSREETAEKLGVQGDVELGLAIGYEDMPVCLSTRRKDIFPRHTVVLGTTGAGKSTAVSRMIGSLSQNDVAVVVFDTEGEYTHLMYPTEDEKMRQLLHSRGLEPAGLADVGIYHLVGRESTHPEYLDRREFGLEFSRMSPYALMEILALNEPQQERFLRAYDIAKHILATLKIYPANRAEEREWLELDELESGCPRLTLAMMCDVVRACAELVADDELQPFSSSLFEQRRGEVISILHARAKSLPGNVWSWRKVQGALGRLLRLRIFDNEDAPLPDFSRMTQPGRVSIIDLSGSDARPIINLAISQLLAGLRKQQEVNYQVMLNGAPLRKLTVIVEEAHEFVAGSRIREMPVLYQMLTGIARRGRKVWMGLIFSSQSPTDLPSELLALANNYLLFRIGNAGVVSGLRQTVGGTDSSVWDRLADLPPGVAIIKSGSLASPMLVSLHASPYKLLMTD